MILAEGTKFESFLRDVAGHVCPHDKRWYWQSEYDKENYEQYGSGIVYFGGGYFRGVVEKYPKDHHMKGFLKGVRVFNPSLTREQEVDINKGIAALMYCKHSYEEQTMRKQKPEQCKKQVSDDLLEALKEVLESLEGFMYDAFQDSSEYEPVVMAKAAIAKAEGRTDEWY